MIKKTPEEMMLEVVRSKYSHKLKGYSIIAEPYSGSPKEFNQYSDQS